MTPADFAGDITYDLARRMGVLEEGRESFEQLMEGRVQVVHDAIAALDRRLGKMAEAAATAAQQAAKGRRDMLLALVAFAGPVTAAVITGAVVLYLHYQ